MRTFTTAATAAARCCLLLALLLQVWHRPAAAARAGGDGQAEARGKWLDEQVRFIEKLGGIGYEDLAERVKRDTLRGVGSPDGKPLSADEKKSLDRAEAKAKLRAAMRLPDLKKKIEYGDQALNAMQSVLAALAGNKTELLKARRDIAEMYFDLGNTLTDEYEKADKQGANSQKQEYARLVAEVDKKMQPVQDKIDALRKEYNALRKKMGKKKNRAKRKELLAQSKAKKAEIKKLEDTLKPLREEKAKLQQESDNIIDVAVLARKAQGYFTAGIALGRKVAKALDDDFWDKMGAMDEAENRRARAAALQRVQASFARKVNFSHKLESAYATQLILYPRGSKAQRDLVKPALDYIDLVIGDYDTYYPKDKYAYLQWIRILSHLNDNLDKPRVEDEKDMGKEELAEARRDPRHYLWPSERMRFLWDYQFTDKLDKLKPKEVRKRLRDYTPTPGARVRGLFYYCKSLLRSARGHFELVARMPDSTKKKRMQQHAGELLKEAEKWLAEVVKIRCVFGKVPESVRLTARLKLETELHLLKGELLAKAGRKDDAKKEVEAAINAVTKVLAEGGSKWRHVVQVYIALVKARGMRIAGPVKLGDTPVAVLAEADNLYSRAVKAAAAAQKQDLFRQAMRKYLDGFNMMKGYKDLHQRANWMPRTMFRIGICAWWARDYLTGYLINFGLVREFGGPRYQRDDDFAQAREYARRALGNLHACAGKVLDQDEKNPALRKLYAEQLYLRMARDPNPDPRLVVKLIDTLKNLRMYEDALALIDDVPASHLYYRMALLLAADIHQTIMKKAQKVCDHIRKRAEKKGRELTAAEKKAIAGQQPIIEQHGVMAEKFALRFKAAVDKRPEPVTENQKKVYAMEDAAIPGALMIPISNQFARKEYAKALAGVDDYIAKVEKLPKLDAESRYRYMATARWVKLLCTYYRVDHKQAPLPQVAAAIQEATDKLLPLLAQDEKRANAAAEPGTGAGPAVSGQPQIKREDLVTKAYMQLASGWNSLANRLMRERKDGETGALKPEDQKLYDEYRRRAAQYFGRAGKIAYTNRSIGMLIGKTYFELGMYQEAVDMYDKVIKYWNESLFTPDYIFRGEKTRKDLKASVVPAAIKSLLGGIIDLGEITGAADDKALLAVLNKYVRSIKYKPHKEAIDKILGEVKAAHADDRALQKLLEHAARLVGREDLERNTGARQKLNRIILEAIFPSVLARSRPIPLIPTPAGFTKATKGVWSVYPPADEAQLKKNLLKYMHDQTLVRLEQDKKAVAAYKRQLKQRFLAAAKQGNKQLQNKLGGYLWLFDNDLRRYVYGVMRKGRILQRSYYRARSQLGGIIRFDKNEIKLEEPKYMPTNAPKASFLMNLDKALSFHGGILSAKRRYALALVKLGKNDQALKYLRELVKFWPGETDLQLDLAEVYAAIGDNLSRPKYNQKAADYFIYSQNEAFKVKKKAKDFSRLWWQCQKVLAHAQTLEVLARTNSKPKALEVNYQTKVMVRYKGKMVPVKRKTPPCLLTKPAKDGEFQPLGQADKLVRNLVALISLKPPEEMVEDFEDMLAELEEAGYKPPKEKKREETGKQEDVPSAPAKQDTGEDKTGAAPDKAAQPRSAKTAGGDKQGGGR